MILPIFQRSIMPLSAEYPMCNSKQGDYQFVHVTVTIYHATVRQITGGIEVKCILLHTEKLLLILSGKKVKQSRYRPGVAQRVPGT
jgi:hypothetical protein